MVPYSFRGWGSHPLPPEQLPGLEPASKQARAFNTLPSILVVFDQTISRNNSSENKIPTKMPPINTMLPAPSQGSGYWEEFAKDSKPLFGWSELAKAAVVAIVAFLAWWFLYLRNRYGHIVRGPELFFNLFVCYMQIPEGCPDWPRGQSPSRLRGSHQ